MSHLQSRWLLICHGKHKPKSNAESAAAAKAIQHVCLATSTTLELLTKHDRTARYSRSRQMAMYILRELGYDFAGIGYMLDRDHSTVSYGVRAVSKRMATSPELCAWVEELLDNIKREVQHEVR